MSDKKPWEEEWSYVHGDYAMVLSGDDTFATVLRKQSGLGEDHDREHDRSTAQLTASAPDLARALLAVEWMGGCDGDGCSVCPYCDARELHGHADDCVINAALRKAGVV